MSKTINIDLDTVNLGDCVAGALADQLGTIKASAAELAAQEKNIKAALIARVGEGSAEGDLFRVTLSNSLRSTVDKDAVIATLAKKAGITDGALQKLLMAHTSTAANWVVRCNARVTK